MCGCITETISMHVECYVSVKYFCTYDFIIPLSSISLPTIENYQNLTNVLCMYVFAVLRKKDAHSCAQAHSEMLSYFVGWVPQMSSKRHISNMNFQYWVLLAVGVQPIAFKISFRDLKTSKNTQISKKRKKALFLQDFLVFRFSCHLLQCTALLTFS